MRGGYTLKDVERLILSMPFRRFEDMSVMHHAKQLGILQMDRELFLRLTEEDMKTIRQSCKRALDRYFGE